MNRAAELIHQLDPTRPVAIANGDLLYLDYIKRFCPAIDVMGANSYRGEQGFGRSLFQDVQEALDRPVLITEYGTCAYGEGYSQKQAEAYQAMYDGNNWEDLEANMAGKGVGNALGGVLFEFMDEWWKANSDLPAQGAESARRLVRVANPRRIKICSSGQARHGAPIRLSHVGRMELRGVVRLGVAGQRTRQPARSSGSCSPAYFTMQEL